METTLAKSIFSTATGFIAKAGFDFTCNPYVGCTFGCTYCYAGYLPQSKRPVSDWGTWLTAKSNAPETARRQAHKIAGAAVYMSSVTDPYLPAERSLHLTRGILEAMLNVTIQPRLVIQTRGPLVIRDIDLFQQFQRIRINVSIPTDSEEIRKRFEPKAPPLADRWLALNELHAAGIPVGICITPTLPISDTESFAEKIASAKAAVVVTQEFHAARGFGADTASDAVMLRDEMKWQTADHQHFVNALRRRVAAYEGLAGFFPPPI